MITATNLHKHYGKLHVLKGVSLSVAGGEVVSIVGTSGAGKTTLLQIMGTLDKADQGELTINHTRLSALGEKKIHAIRNKEIGFIFQFHHLLPEFTAIENICIPAYIAGESKEKTEEKAKELLGFLGLTQRANHKPAELSGGEQQRIAVARALINQPSIILADEPSGNLDSATAKELHNLFFLLREKFNQTFIIVTHNEELANMADRKLVMKDGMILS
jgi:lipoprotein-releasing system ATP-binding protein